MTEAGARLGSDPHQEPERGVTATPPVQRTRAAVFQTCVLVTSALFIALAVVARSVDYFPIDLAITRALQNHHGIVFDRLMFALSWLGFMPQLAVLGGLIVALLLLAGLRWEAVVALFAACGLGMGALVKLAVARPRPSVDLVRVIPGLDSSGFPSGHVVEFTTFFGFLAFLAYTLLKPSWGRTTLIAALILLIVLIGPSRIYLGQHWFSDVMGAYLLGSLWLALTVRMYRWGKSRFASQPFNT